MVVLPGDVRVPVSIGDTTVVKNFYVERLPDGTETDVAEDEFCEVEGKAVAAISALIDRRVWPIPDQLRFDIATWAALQYLRVPWVRQLVREFTEAFSDVGVAIDMGAGGRSRWRMPPEEVARQSRPELHLEFIRRQTAVVSNMLCARDWELTFYSRRSLATCDTPVVLRPMIVYPAGTTVPIASAAAVQIPLDRRVALSMITGNTGDRITRGVTKTALDLNQAIIANTRRYIFHHPGENPLEELTLREPRERELASPEAAAALLGQLFS